MWYELSRHKVAYLILSLVMIGFVMAYLAFWPHRWWLRILSVAMAMFYVAWGITTHVKTRAITKQVVYEYLGVAGLAVLGLWAMTL